MTKIERARIAYSGPALENGAMDIRELAPSLLAFASLIENANKAIGSEHQVRILLNQDSFRRGSFDITTIIQYPLLEQAKLFIAAADASGLTSLMTVLGWGTSTKEAISGIFSLIKTIRNRTIKKAKYDEDSNKVELHLADGDIVITTKNTMKVFVNVNCREAIEKVMTPLHTEGIDSFELRNPNTPNNRIPIESIQKEEAVYFKSPPAAQTEAKEKLPEQEITVKITSINFEKGNKWRLTDGNNTFWAKIQDNVFLDKVENGELSFTNGDMLRIRYYIQQTVKNNNLSSEYIVTKVLELRKRPEQIKFDFDMGE